MCIRDRFPDARNVGILYCSAEPNSVYQATEFGKYLDEDGISHKEYTVADSNDIASVVQSAVSEVDVIYIPTDNTMAGNTEAIDNLSLIHILIRHLGIDKRLRQNLHDRCQL